MISKFTFVIQNYFSESYFLKTYTLEINSDDRLFQIERIEPI